MMKKGILIITILIQLLQHSTAQEIYSTNIYFETGSFSFTVEQQRSLDSFYLLISKKERIFRWSIIGHTDNVGSASFNDSLSNKRSLSVYQYTTTKGIHPTDLFIEGKGYKSPVASNKTEDGKAKNRRVEIVVEDWNSYLMRELNLGPEKICLSFQNAKGMDTILASGTHLIIPPEMFAYCDKKEISGMVQFCFTEYHSMADHVLSKYPLSFTSNGKIYFYESGGMFETNVYKDKEEVCLIQGKKIIVDYSLADTTKKFAFYKFKSDENRWVVMDDGKEENVKIPVKTEIKKEKLKDEKKNKSNNTNKTQTKKSKLKKQIDEEEYLKAFIFMYLALDCYDIVEIAKWGIELSKINHNTFSHKISKSKRYEYKNYIGTYPIAWGINTAEMQRRQDIKILKSNESQKGTTIIDLEFDSTLHPELKVFNNYSWKYSDKRNKGLDKSYFDKKFNDAKILYSKSKKSFSIELKDTSDLYRFSAKLVAKNRKNKMVKRKAIKQIVKQFKDSVKYQNLLFDDPSKLFPAEKSLYEKYDQTLLWLVGAHSDYGIQRQLSKQQWLEYFNSNKKLMAEQLKKFSNWDCIQIPCCQCGDTLIYLDSFGGSPKQKVSVKKIELGVFNYDILKTLEGVKEYNINYITEEKTKIEAKIAYLYDKNLVGLIQLKSINKIKLRPESNNTLILFDNYARIYLVSEVEMKKLIRKTDKAIDLNCIEITETIRGTKDLKTALGMK